MVFVLACYRRFLCTQWERVIHLINGGSPLTRGHRVNEVRELFLQEPAALNWCEDTAEASVLAQRAALFEWRGMYYAKSPEFRRVLLDARLVDMLQTLSREQRSDAIRMLAYQPHRCTVTERKLVVPLQIGTTKTAKDYVIVERAMVLGKRTFSATCVPR